MRAHPLFKFISPLIVASIVFSACQNSSTVQSPASGVTSSPTVSNGGSTATDQSNAVAITIQNMTFSPKDVQVKVGQTVTWTNKDGYAHTITSDNGVFDSGNVAGDGTFSFTFTKEGKYPYHCNIHPSMTAQITVTK